MTFRELYDSNFSLCVLSAKLEKVPKNIKFARKDTKYFEFLTFFGIVFLCAILFSNFFLQFLFHV